MPIVEIGDDGVRRIPAGLLGGSSDHRRFELEQVGEVTLLR
jgi:hypothetical protein